MKTLRVKLVETVWDNYQGASGNPIVRSILINLPEDTNLSMVETLVIDKLNKQGIRSDYHNKLFQMQGLLSIEILPQI